MHQVDTSITALDQCDIITFVIQLKSLEHLVYGINVNITCSTPMHSLHIFFMYLVYTNVFKFDCVGSYKLIETLSNPFLELTSTKQLM
jgi:hypothetical protein